MTPDLDPVSGAPSSELHPAPVARFDLPLDVEAPAIARRTVAGILEVWVPDAPDFVHDVVLMTSELVSNAIRHGGDRVGLEVRRAEDALIVAVADGSPLLPEPRASSETDEGGRGLVIVEAIAEATGVEEDGAGGKRVWARVRLPGTAA